MSEPLAINAIRPFFAAPARGTLTFGNAGDNQSILLSGIQSEVARVIELLREADGQRAADETPAPQEALQRRIAELEQTIQQLRKEIADLKKRIGHGR